MRYANSTEYESTAVLIGDFMNADDERMKTVLDKVKYMQPKALDFPKLVPRRSVMRQFVSCHST